MTPALEEQHAARRRGKQGSIATEPCRCLALAAERATTCGGGQFVGPA
jgi:hypothetical protein